MKFTFGYRFTDDEEEPLTQIARDLRASIAEVYFPWPGLPSGRSPLGEVDGAKDWDAQQRVETELRVFKDMGIRLNLLLNASCYGRHGVSRYLANLVRSIVAHLSDTVGLDSVTTMSPLIAETLKRDFPAIEVRASVNMRLGTVKALQYVAHLFDAFYLQREFNRELERIAELHSWCRGAGKRLCILANSGCLNFCSVQTFHDNLVSHESGVAQTLNAETELPGLCWQYYRQLENRVAFLQNSWIRPEDVHHYEPYFSTMKLATRMHSNPGMVVRAYCRGKFSGNLPDLFEPGHSRMFAPFTIDNTRFPEDWFQRTSACDKRCHQCDYCSSVLERVLVRTG